MPSLSSLSQHSVTVGACLKKMVVVCFCFVLCFTLFCLNFKIGSLYSMEGRSAIQGGPGQASEVGL